MPPKFSLQNVLDYRHSKVEKLEVVLGHLQNQLQNAREQLAAIEVQKQSLLVELGSYQHGDLNMQKILQARSFLKKIQKGIDRQKIEIERLAVETENARLALVQAKQDEIALEKLSQKELQVYTDRVNMREKQQQDDIYISQAHAASEKKMRERVPNVRFVF
ncbi:MAG: flagellar export protein FliJ [Leptolinea sp.]|jgi:flagellar export protein FliJ|nr:flagellar export protein FliJ [Leptolinea sp.]